MSQKEKSDEIKEISTLMLKYQEDILHLKISESDNPYYTKSSEEQLEELNYDFGECEK